MGGRRGIGAAGGARGTEGTGGPGGAEGIAAKAIDSVVVSIAIIHEVLEKRYILAGVSALKSIEV